MKTLNFALDDDEYDLLNRVKGEYSWKELLIAGARELHLRKRSRKGR